LVSGDGETSVLIGGIIAAVLMVVVLKVSSADRAPS
jgi:hypothetical protein